MLHNDVYTQDKKEITDLKGEWRDIDELLISFIFPPGDNPKIQKKKTSVRNEPLQLRIFNMRHALIILIHNNL